MCLNFERNNIIEVSIRMITGVPDIIDANVMISVILYTLTIIYTIAKVIACPMNVQKEDIAGNCTANSIELIKPKTKWSIKQ